MCAIVVKFETEPFISMSNQGHGAKRNCCHLSTGAAETKNPQGVCKQKGRKSPVTVKHRENIMKTQSRSLGNSTCVGLRQPSFDQKFNV